MKPLVRWLVASLVTVAVFAVLTAICGALVLPTVMKDPGSRWGVAGGLGVAVAALAALWGHSFATAERSASPAHRALTAESTNTETGPGATSNNISGGTFHQSVIQGRDISGPVVNGGVSPQTADPNPQD